MLYSQQLGSDFGERSIAEFIDDDQFHARPAGRHADTDVAESDRRSCG